MLRAAGPRPSRSSSARRSGLIHYAWGPAGMVQTAFTGLALGAAYLAVGRRLWMRVVAHAGLDTLRLLQVYLGDSIGPHASRWA